MVDTMFQYQAFESDADQVHQSLNELAAEGWRLFSCHPFSIRGQAGVDSTRYSIVMERLAPEPEDSEKPDAREGGMPMG